MSNSNYFLRQYSFEEFFHGGIGYTDAEKIMEKNGFAAIEFPRHHHFTFSAKLSRFVYLVKTSFKVKRGSIVIFILPVFARLQKLLLRFLRLKRDVRLVCLLADIDGLKDGDKRLLAEEVDELSRYEYFIVHNEAMKLWLRGLLPSAKIAVIEFFDFLTPPVNQDRQKAKEIAFAGNLTKSIFLESLGLLQEKSQELFFNLYGPGSTDKMTTQENVRYKGIILPHKLPASIEGSFGLVWDGDSIEGTGGSLGEYMRYISHHKLSLYILAGLPLIVPAMAASATLVSKYKIGITISSLYEIDSAIEKVSDDDYQQMRENMKPLAEKISSGKCLTSAIQALMEKSKSK